MLPDIIEDQTFTKVTAKSLTDKKSTFENCWFVNCDFSYADLSKQVFTDCEFEGCNLSLVKLIETGLQDVRFKNCKLSGADFSKSHDFLFAVNFETVSWITPSFIRRRTRARNFWIARW